jgi:hypothetical protein
MMMAALATTWDPIAANGFDGCSSHLNTAFGRRDRLSVADVGYGVLPNGIRFGVNFSEHDNIWGYNDASQASIMEPWPGVTGSSPHFSMSRTGYFGAHFRTTAAAPAPGYFLYGNYGGSIPISVSISRSCGDFSGDPAIDGCYVYNHPSDDASILRWEFGEGISPYRCRLQPDTDYYLNVMFTDPHPVDPVLAQKCSSGASACPILLKSMGH